MQPTQYNDPGIPPFAGNPMIQALPPIPREKDLVSHMMRRQEYSDSMRTYPPEQRLYLTQEILRFHQPLQEDIRLAQSLDQCLRWGYVGRNPSDPIYVRMMNERYAAGLEGKLPQISHTKAIGFSVLGVSGVGKTVTTEIALDLYPQIIQHEGVFGDIPLHTRQVVWLKIDCPPDGSLKGLVKNFLAGMDCVCATSYLDQYERYSLDSLIVRMADVAAKENLGILIIDEAQHLALAKQGGSRKVLNFLVTLVNTIGVPVIMIGTPLAMEILQRDFQHTRRASGQGNFFFGNLQPNVGMTNLWIDSLWGLQFTKHVVKMTDESKEALLQDAFGNPYLTNVLYMLVQKDAIQSGRDQFDAKDIHRVAETRLSLTAPMREAMKKGQDVNIKKYLEEIGILDPPCNGFFTPDPMSHEDTHPVFRTSDKASAMEKALRTLVEGMGMVYNDALCAINAVLADAKETLPHTMLANKAYTHWIGHREKDEKKPTTQAKGYKELKNRGLIGDGVTNGEETA